jgi:hypothetical protein
MTNLLLLKAMGEPTFGLDARFDLQHRPAFQDNRTEGVRELMAF